MATSFADFPRATQLRLAAVAVLQAAGTLAGANVLDTPLDALDPEKTYPVIAVITTTDRVTAAKVGGIPAFRITYNLHIGVGIVDADPRAAVLACDQLAQQVRDALFCDPVMVKLLGQVDTVTETPSGGKGTARYVAKLEQVISTVPVSVGEIYPVNTTSVLLPTGEPQATFRTVITPLLNIDNATDLPNQAADQPPSAALNITLSQT